MRGLAHPPLDDAGNAEAGGLAVILAEKPASLVISSPRDRARRAAEIKADIAVIPHLVDDCFNNRDYGPQTGQIKTEVEVEDDAPMVEPTSFVLDRARPALDGLHHAIIRLLIASIALLCPMPPPLAEAVYIETTKSGPFSHRLEAHGELIPNPDVTQVARSGDPHRRTRLTRRSSRSTVSRRLPAERRPGTRLFR